MPIAAAHGLLLLPALLATFGPDGDGGGEGTAAGEGGEGEAVVSPPQLQL